MRQFLSASEPHVADLGRVLEAGNHFRTRTEFPPSFEPRSGEVVFDRDQGGFVLHLLPPGLRYTGQDPWLASAVQAGSARAATLPDLFRLLDRHLGPEFGCPVTDLQAARELLERDTPAEGVDPDLLARRLKEHIVEQDGSLDLLARHVGSFTARQNFRRPANALLLGPTGVGKTETAASLGRLLGEATPPYEYVRVDLNEMNLEHQSARFTGAPPGYVGYDDVPELIRAVRRNPRVTVLFDEVEKAHKDLLRVLMSLLDTGRLSTARGGADGRHGEDFSRSILLFTSNLASPDLERLRATGLPQDSQEFQERVRGLLIQHGMLPEIAGRFQLFLVYNRISPEGMLRIVAQQVGSVAGDYGLQVVRIEPAVVAALTSQVLESPAQVRGACQGIERLLAAPFARFRTGAPEARQVRVEGEDLASLRVVAS